MCGGWEIVCVCVWWVGDSVCVCVRVVRMWVEVHLNI